MAFVIGTEVYEYDDPTHIGIVEKGPHQSTIPNVAIKAYIRWHKHFASWVEVSKLRYASDLRKE